MDENNRNNPQPKSRINITTFVLLALILVPLYHIIQSRYKPVDKVTVSRQEPVSSGNGVLDAARDNALNNPGFDAYFNLGFEYFKNGQYEFAVNATLKAIEYNPDSYKAYNNLCSSYNELHLWDEAIAACEKSLELNPDYELARNNLNWARQNKQ